MAFYVFHESNSIRDPRVLGGIAGLVLCAGLFAWLAGHARPMSFALLWIGATLAPVPNARWMPAKSLPNAISTSLRSAFAGWWAGPPQLSGDESEAEPRSTGRLLLRQAVAVGLVVAGCAYAVIAVERNRDWRTDEVLYRRTLEEQPDAQIIHTNLGVVYSDRGDWADAEREWTLRSDQATPMP